MFSPYNVVHILKHCNFSNGHVHVAVDLACEQARRGYNVVFASAGGTYVRLLESSGVHHTSLSHSKARIPQDLFTLRRLISRRSPVVLHAHMMTSAVLGYMATRLFGGAIVTTVHNSFDRHSMLMRLGDRVVAVSEAEEKLLLAKNYNPERLSVVLNGPIGSPRVRAAPAEPLDLPHPCIISVSGLHERKRVQDVIKAFSTITNEFPKWSLVIVGAGPDEMLLKQYVSDISLTKRVVFTGPLQNAMNALRQADIFISLSEAEPFGLNVVEARESGCAIIVSKVGGMPEIVDYGRSGVIVPARDVGAAALALRDLLSSASNLSYWRNAAKRDLGRFEIKRMAEDYEAVYSKALSCRYKVS